MITSTSPTISQWTLGLGMFTVTLVSYDFAHGQTRTRPSGEEAILLVKCARAQQGLDLDILEAEPELESVEGDISLCRANYGLVIFSLLRSSVFRIFIKLCENHRGRVFNSYLL